MITAFIFKPILASGILYLYYLCVLKNKTFHSYNRFYLLLSVIVSVVAPFINFGWVSIETPMATPLYNFTNHITLFTKSHPGKFFTPRFVLLLIGVLISILLLLSLLLKIR